MEGCLPFFGGSPKTTANSPSKRRVNSLRGNFVTKYETPIEADYDIDTNLVLGTGAFGTVVRSRNRVSSHEYAVKFVKKSGGLNSRLEREIKMLTDIDHPNIARLFAIYDTSTRVGFVMELCTGGNLQELMRRDPLGYLTEDTAKIIMRQLVSAVTHIHALGICHRDIKLQNILMANIDTRDPQAKLIDFGYATRFVGITPLKSRVGTPYTTAPEVIRECYDERCDIWSLGVVTYILLCGQRPFSSAGNNKIGVTARILKGRYQFNHQAFYRVSAEGIEFVREMLNPNYLRRWSAIDSMQSTWLSHSLVKTSFDFDALNDSDTPLSIAMANLRAKEAFSVLGNVALVAVAFGMQLDKTTEIRKLFDSFDNGEGYLIPETFKSAMNALLLDVSNEEYLDRLFQIIDVDMDGQVSYMEFLAATLDPNEVGNEELGKAFRLFDSDNKGYLTVDDFFRVLATSPRKRRNSKLLRGITVAGRRAEDISNSGDDFFQTSSILSRNDREKKLVASIKSMILLADSKQLGALCYSDFIAGVVAENPNSVLFCNSPDPHLAFEDNDGEGGLPPNIRPSPRATMPTKSRLSFTESIQSLFRRTGRKTYPVARKSTATKISSPLASSRKSMKDNKAEKEISISLDTEMGVVAVGLSGSPPRTEQPSSAKFSQPPFVKFLNRISGSDKSDEEDA